MEIHLFLWAFVQVKKSTELLKICTSSILVFPVLPHASSVFHQHLYSVCMEVNGSWVWLPASWCPQCKEQTFWYQQVKQTQGKDNLFLMTQLCNPLSWDQHQTEIDNKLKSTIKIWLRLTFHSWLRSTTDWDWHYLKGKQIPQKLVTHKFYGRFK